MYFNLKGLCLGLGIFLVGLILDNTISYKSKKYLFEKNSRLLIKAYCYTAFNLLVLSPLYYDILDKYLISHEFIEFDIFKYFALLIIQSIGYYLAHYMMHNNRKLRVIHKFHHKFTNVLIPSLGISVTPYEYTFAYVLPFLVGGYIVNPSLLTLNTAIGSISLLNIIIHCNELSHIKYYRYLVSPNDHFNHHKNDRFKNTYAAPLINIDNILEDI
jgi:sterol desaturase/sphingolipid hydroxylase (fatty acid hydroxylase superfamily)